MPDQPTPSKAERIVKHWDYAPCPHCDAGGCRECQIKLVSTALTDAEARVWEEAANFVKGDRNNPPETEYDYSLFSLEKEFQRRAATLRREG